MVACIRLRASARAVSRQRADEYRRVLLNSIREAWNAYGSAVERAVEVVKTTAAWPHAFHHSLEDQHHPALHEGNAAARTS